MRKSNKYRATTQKIVVLAKKQVMGSISVFFFKEGMKGKMEFIVFALFLFNIFK